MPNPGSDRPLRKITLNLYEEDVRKAEATYGHGWTTNLREIFHAHLNRKVHKTVEEILREHGHD